MSEYDYDQELLGEDLYLVYCPRCRRVETIAEDECNDRCECGCTQRRKLELYTPGYRVPLGFVDEGKWRNQNE